MQDGNQVLLPCNMHSHLRVSFKWFVLTNTLHYDWNYTKMHLYMWFMIFCIQYSMSVMHETKTLLYWIQHSHLNRNSQNKLSVHHQLPLKTLAAKGTVQLLQQPKTSHTQIEALLHQPSTWEQNSFREKRTYPLDRSMTVACTHCSSNTSSCTVTAENKKLLQNKRPHKHHTVGILTHWLSSSSKRSHNSFSFIEILFGRDKRQDRQVRGRRAVGFFVTQVRREAFNVWREGLPWPIS